MPITAPPPPPDARAPYRWALGLTAVALIIVGWAQAGGRALPWTRWAAPALIIANVATAQFGLLRRWPTADRLAPYLCIAGAIALGAAVLARGA